MLADDLVDIGETQAGAWRVQVAVDAPESGVGSIIALFDERRTAEAKPMELTAATGLQLRALGSLGQRRLRVELVGTLEADAHGVTVGVVEPDRLLPDEWRLIELPINPAETPYAGFIRFVAEGEGPAWFAFDWIALSAPNPQPEKSIASGSKHSLRTAMWVWHTAEILPDDKRRADLLEFCKRHSVTDLFCQMKYEYADGVVELKQVD